MKGLDLGSPQSFDTLQCTYNSQGTDRTVEKAYEEYDVEKFAIVFITM
jgi:hypothetical protein